MTFLRVSYSVLLHHWYFMNGNIALATMKCRNNGFGRTPTDKLIFCSETCITLLSGRYILSLENVLKPSVLARRVYDKLNCWPLLYIITSYLPGIIALMLPLPQSWGEWYLLLSIWTEKGRFCTIVVSRLIYKIWEKLNIWRAKENNLEFVGAFVLDVILIWNQKIVVEIHNC